MRIIVAQSLARSSPSLEGHVQALCDMLATSGHDVQRVDLPAIADAEHALSTLASHRLLAFETHADVIICLDPLSAVLPHPRKIVWLLEEGALRAEVHGSAEAIDPAARYLANVLAAGIEEALHRFAPSPYAKEVMNRLGFTGVSLLEPDVGARVASEARQPGRELLLLSPLDDHQRAALVVDCLGELPEPFRARWVAPSSTQPSSLLEVRRLIDMRGLAGRMIIEARPIEAGERDYLLARAAALLEVGRGAFTVPQYVDAALIMGVPVIACADGGALAGTHARPSIMCVDPQGRALARAVEAVASGVHAPPQSRSGKRIKGWAPLTKVLAA
jgi:hypothetical protein